MLDMLRKEQFLNALAIIRVEAPSQYAAVVECVLFLMPYAEIAERRGTTEDAIRLAKMRGMRNLRRICGGWIDQFIEAIHDARTF